MLQQSTPELAPWLCTLVSRAPYVALPVLPHLLSDCTSVIVTRTAVMLLHLPSPVRTRRLCKHVCGPPYSKVQDRHVLQKLSWKGHYICDYNTTAGMQMHMQELAMHAANAGS